MGTNVKLTFLKIILGRVKMSLEKTINNNSNNNNNNKKKYLYQIY